MLISGNSDSLVQDIQVIPCLSELICQAVRKILVGINSQPPPAAIIDVVSIAKRRCRLGDHKSRYMFLNLE